MSTPLFVVMCRSRGGLSANEKDETFASNDNNRYSWYYFSFPPDFQFRDLRKINKENETIKWEWWIFVSCYLQSCFFCFRHFQGKRKTWNRYSRCYFLFVSEFRFRDLRKINKENESIKWEQLLMRMMNLCKLLFAVLLFLFATFKLFFRPYFNTFSLRKNKIKNGTLDVDYVTRKLKWKLAIRDSWFVAILVSEPCQRAPLYPLACTPFPLPSWSSSIFPFLSLQDDFSSQLCLLFK